jgi:hypothetical protein
MGFQQILKRKYLSHAALLFFDRNEPLTLSAEDNRVAAQTELSADS